jgi:hypothetical protein
MSTIPAPPPTYTRLTQGAFLSMLSTRLGDSGNVFWTLPELRLYLAEALRTWQAYTGWYRNRAVLNAKQNQVWYDLSASLTPGLMAYSITDQSLASAILYHLLEPQLNAGAWAGTDQFSLAQVQAAIQNRLNRFLGDSGLVISYVLQDLGAAPPIGRIGLPTGTIDVRRVAFVDSTTNPATYTGLWKSSEWELNAFLQSWNQTPDVPQVWSQSVTNPDVIQLAPPPANTGKLELLLVSPGPTANLAGNGVVLNVPDDFAWGVKWGAIADLLGADGQAKDITRAQYAEQRYQECVQLAKTFPALMQLYVNGVQVWVGSVWDMDAFDPGWENAASGTPQTFGMAGRNMLAMSPAPNADMNLAVDVIANMPVPASDADTITIPSDVLPALVDYTFHLASFKMGGNEFLSTIPQRNNLLVEAANYNQRLRQLDFYNDAMRSPSLTQLAEQPRIETPLLVSYQPQQITSG